MPAEQGKVHSSVEDIGQGLHHHFLIIIMQWHWVSNIQEASGRLVGKLDKAVLARSHKKAAGQQQVVLHVGLMHTGKSYNFVA